MFLVLSFMFIFSFFKNFSKSLMNIILLECLMITILCFFYWTGEYRLGLFLICCTLTILMVLDSIFGVTCLLGVSRCNSAMEVSYRNF